MSGLNAKTRKILSALKDAARVAEVMVDGEEAQNTITDRAYDYMTRPNPLHVHEVGDFFDVDLDSFLRMKKTLLRLELLLDFPCSTSLWVRTKGANDKLTLLVHNGKVSRYYSFGDGAIPLEGDLKTCIETGETQLLAPTETEERITALAPVRDSLGDVVGAVEFSLLDPSSKNLEPAWS